MKETVVAKVTLKRVHGDRRLALFIFAVVCLVIPVLVVTLPHTILAKSPLEWRKWAMEFAGGAVFLFLAYRLVRIGSKFVLTAEISSETINFRCLDESSYVETSVSFFNTRVATVKAPQFRAMTPSGRFTRVRVSGTRLYFREDMYDELKRLYDLTVTERAQ